MLGVRNKDLVQPPLLLNQKHSPFLIQFIKTIAADFSRTFQNTRAIFLIQFIKTIPADCFKVLEKRSYCFKSSYCFIHHRK